jgi:hypothetical protein
MPVVDIAVQQKGRSGFVAQPVNPMAKLWFLGEGMS